MRYYILLCFIFLTSSLEVSCQSIIDTIGKPLYVTNETFTDVAPLYDVVISFPNVEVDDAYEYKTKESRAKYVYQKLWNHALSTQKTAIDYLKNHHKEHQSFYIVNMVRAKLDSTDIKYLKALPEVMDIIPNGKMEMARPARENPAEKRTTEWGLDMIKAPDVWALGYTGQGVVIGGQDTGYKWDHDALKDKYRGWDGTTADHDYNWHDAIHTTAGSNPCGSDSPVPCDDHNHGTHTMGTMVGDDGAGNQIGVAPGAKWIGCRNMDLGNGTLSTYVECFEWFLAPYPVGGTPAQGDPSKSPDVINNSWSCPASEGCNSSNYAIMETAMENLRNSGVVIVVSNGNSGSNCSTTFSPPAFYLNAFSVGATNASDQIAGFSSRGPVLYDASNRLKPNVSAPGQSVRSCIKNGGYAVYSGTSMAGPHVAGTVALMLSANPSLKGHVEKIERIIEQTTVPKSTSQDCGPVAGTDTPNNTYGYGRIDALAAVNRALDSLYVPYIKVDQFGYKPNGPKIAIISDPNTGYNSGGNYTPPPLMYLKDAFTHEILFSATPIPWKGGAVDSLSGDKVWRFDFSSFTTPGQYYISDNQGERSEDFAISEDVYDPVLATAFKTFYYQRCGVPKDSAYAGAGYYDPACHIQDTQCKYIQDPYNPSFYKDLSGGWHDAGDHSKYVNYTYRTVINMLMAYELNPQAWNDNMGIPESGNGIPDLLDEIKVELDWLMKMQDGDGGVYSIVGTLNYATASPPSADNADRYYGPKTTSASFSVSSIFALASMQYKKLCAPGMDVYAADLEAKAIQAYNWATANPNVTYDNTVDVIASSNQETDAYERNMRHLVAAIYLYALTGNNTYKSYAETHYTDTHMIQWGYIYPFEPITQSALMFFAHTPGTSSTVSNAIINVYKSEMETFQQNLPSITGDSSAYMAFLAKEDITWGSNRDMCEKGNMYQLYKHYNLNPTNDSLSTLAMDGIIHYMHGVNPNALAYLTNMESMGADRSVNTIYHEWFKDGSLLWDDNRTSTFGPPPGFVPGGPNPQYALDGCCPAACGSENPLCVSLSPPMNQPALKSYYEWNADWPQNSWSVTENAIYYQAAYLLLLSQSISTVPASTTMGSRVIVKDDNLVIDAPSEGVVLTSPAGTKYRLVADANGNISTTNVTSISSPKTIVKNAFLYIDNAGGGILQKENQNDYRLIYATKTGKLLASTTVPLAVNVKKSGGDLWIDQYMMGLILKDSDGYCYLIQVDDAGKLCVSAIGCE